MLSNATLERVSVAYRRGYRDGSEGKAPFCGVKPEYIKPFAQGDYGNGWRAGVNDALWEAYYAGRMLVCPLPRAEG